MHWSALIAFPAGAGRAVTRRSIAARARSAYALAALRRMRHGCGVRCRAVPAGAEVRFGAAQRTSSSPRRGVDLTLTCISLTRCMHPATCRSTAAPAARLAARHGRCGASRRSVRGFAIDYRHAPQWKWGSMPTFAGPSKDRAHGALRATFTVAISAAPRIAAGVDGGGTTPRHAGKAVVIFLVDRSPDGYRRRPSVSVDFRRLEEALARRTPTCGALVPRCFTAHAHSSASPPPFDLCQPRSHRHPPHGTILHERLRRRA